MNIRKVLPILLYVLLFSFISVSLAFTQTTPETAEVTTDPSAQNSETELQVINQLSQSPFIVEIVVGAQSPWDKSVPITVKTKPSADTTRTNITWDVPIGLALTDKNAQRYIPIAKGEVYSAEVRVKPAVSGTYTIAATATDWGYGSNFASTSSVSITFDKNLTVTPAQPAYANAVIIRFVVLGFATVLGIAVFVIVIRILLKRLKEYLKPPEL